MEQMTNQIVGASKVLPKVEFKEEVRIGIDDLNAMLAYCISNGVEDLVLITGSPWAVIWSQRLVFRGGRDLDTEELAKLVVSITNNANAALDLKRGEPIDFNYSMQIGRGASLRFRCCATGCLGPQGKAGIHLVMRPGGKIPPTMDELKLPSYIKDNALPKQGLIIICGPTGSGKTTLLDSILRAQATDPDGKHILTYYSPVENDLNEIPGRTAIIAQCEVGRQGQGAHIHSYAEATRNSLRRHAHVIAYGEARDRVTIEGAVLSAMTGHMTYTTTHVSNVPMAIPRMGDVFEGSDRIRMTNGLIDVTRMIVHQRLLKRPSGVGRAPVRSALVITQEMRSELLKTGIDRLPAAIHELTNQYGIGLLDNAIEQYEAGEIHSDEMLALEAELKSEVF